MTKIPKNLSDKDMFKGYTEEKTLEEAFLETEEQAQKANPFVTPPMEDINIAYLTRDIIEKLGKMLLNLKLDLYKEGIADYNIVIERIGNKIVLSPMVKK